MGLPIHLIIKILLCKGHLLVSIHMGQNYLHFFFLLRESIHIPLPQISFSLTFQSCSHQVPDHPAKSLVTVHELVQNYILIMSDYFSINKVNNHLHSLKFCPLMGG
jgi:hypothetical protein